MCFQKLCIWKGKGIPCFGRKRSADPTLKSRLVEHADAVHTGTRADFFFGMYQLETRFARIIIIINFITVVYGLQHGVRSMTTVDGDVITFTCGKLPGAM